MQVSTNIGEAVPERQLIEISGADRVGFLQGLVTNDVRRLRDGLVYAALLTPQGKYLADFFLVPYGDAILLDADAAQADALARRLMMYRLRADVTIGPSAVQVTRGLGEALEGAFADTRHPALGWRAYGSQAGEAPSIDWDAIRVEYTIPASGIELIADDTYILEAGFERLHGVDFHKGCYVGQELTARMKHKTELRKGLVTVGVSGPAEPGDAITTENGRAAGTLFTRTGDRALAHLRFDRAEGSLHVGSATVTYPV